MKIATAILAAAIAMPALTSTIAWSASEAVVKVWTPPSQKTQAQALVDGLMKDNPGLLSVTFHGVPVGSAKEAYAMFAGSFPDRVGKASADDDIMVAAKGFTIIDPRYGKNDPEPKFLVLVPLRDAKSKNVGCIVFAFKNPKDSGKTEAQFLASANTMRDGIQSKIADHAALFAAAK
jgi:hypothetical protein